MRSAPRLAVMAFVDRDGTFCRSVFSPVISKDGALGLMIVKEAYHAPPTTYDLLELFHTGKLKVVKDEDDGGYILIDDNGTPMKGGTKEMQDHIENAISFLYCPSICPEGCSRADSAIMFEED